MFAFSTNRLKDEPKTFREDNSGTTYYYYGTALPGTAESDSAWLIMRETVATKTIVFANGKASSINKWSERASLTYK